MIQILWNPVNNLNWLMQINQVAKLSQLNHQWWLRLAINRISVFNFESQQQVMQIFHHHSIKIKDIQVVDSVHHMLNDYQKEKLITRPYHSNPFPTSTKTPSNRVLPTPKLIPYDPVGSYYGISEDPYCKHDNWLISIDLLWPICLDIIFFIIK